MTDVPDTVIESLAAPIAAAFPVVRQRIPTAALTELGRPADNTTDRSTTARRVRAGESPVSQALRDVGPLVTERLLGALEQTVPTLEFPGAPDFAPYLDPPRSGAFAYATARQDSQALTAMLLLAQIRPGIVELIEDVTRRLAEQPTIGPLLAPATDATDEASIAGTHAAAYVALAVTTASAVLAGRSPQDGPAAAIGTGIGVAALLLRTASMPPAYADALLAKQRAEYRLPRSASGMVAVSDHRFALAEGNVPESVDFAGNGLAAAVDGGVVIRTGVQDGHVHVWLNVVGEQPPVATGWDEVVDVSWHATAGHASIIGAHWPANQSNPTTPPWPGDYRLRVAAYDRDGDEGSESYQLVVWQAPSAPEIVHKRTDRLGYRLRGEPEPVRTPRPELAYRWVRHSVLGDAATVTVVTGMTVDDVLRAFGADPAQPESLVEISEDTLMVQSLDPWVTVLDAGTAVLAVEFNGFQGSYAPLLRRASAGGRAASMYWNVNAVTRLSLAEGGRLLASFEPPAVVDSDPAVAEALAGLDFEDYRNKEGKGLVAVQRFTGRGITEGDLALIKDADIAYRIVPDLPELYPYRELSPGMGELPGMLPLGQETTDVLLALPEPALRDFAWWCAGEAAYYASRAHDRDVTESIAARALTPSAHDRARRAQLSGGEHQWLWLALHRATNPDPRAAATETLTAARNVAGSHAAELVTHARAWLASTGGDD